MYILSSPSTTAENHVDQDFRSLGMMHTGGNLTNTVPSAHSDNAQSNVPVLPSQQQPSGRTQNDSTSSGSVGQHRRRRDRGKTGHPSSSTSVNNASSTSSNRVVSVVPPGSAASSSTTATAAKAKRKRSMIACRNCNERRVRCDGSITGLPCTTCKSAGRTDCAFIDSKRVRGKRGRFESRDKLRSQSEAESPTTPGEQGSVKSRSVALTRSPRSIPSSIPQSLPHSVFPSGTSPSGSHPNLPYNSSTQSPLNNHIQSGPSRGQSSITENHIWRRLFESQPGVPQTQRITYVGEAWHLSWVLHQKTGSAPLHFASPVEDDSPETQPVRRSGSADVQLDKPIAGSCRIGQLVSEIEGSNSQAAVTVQASIDAFVVPPPPIRDALIEAYFSHFHPFFPILSKERFESHLNSSMTNKSPSLLLLQSMLMIGALHCPLSLLTSPLASHTDWKPYSTRANAIEAFVHRARMLFNIDHEKDRLSVIQSMFLLQFWWRIPGEYKDQSYWMAGALRIAQSMGLHRSTRDSWAKGILDEQERTLWRKMWWALYIRDRQIAAAMGQPVLIHDEDCDVEALCMQDFPTEPKETAMFMIESVKLVRVLHEILKCEFTPALKAADGPAILPSNRVLRRERCQGMLEDWQRKLPPELGGDLMVADTSVTAGSPRFYKQLMQLIFKIYFQSFELLLHRPIFPKGPGCGSSTTGTSTSLGSGGAADRAGYTNVPTSSRQPPAPIVSHAAKMITQHGRTVYTICGRDVRFLPLNYVSFLFAALSVQLVELKSSDAEKERIVRDDVNFNLFFLGSLSEMYPIAGWCRKLLVKILSETDATEEVAQPQDVSDKGRVPDYTVSQNGLERMSQSHQSPTQRDPPNPHINFNPESQYSQQQQDTDLQHSTDTIYEHVPAVSESAYRNFQNAHPHYNPHHAYHNINCNQLPPSPENGPDGYSHVSGSSVEATGEILQPPTVPAFNPFDLPSSEAHSNRIRSMGIRYIDPSPTESTGPNQVSTPMATSAITVPTIPINGTGSVQEHEKRRLSEKWAGDVMLGTNLLRVATDSSQQQQPEPDLLRYHMTQEEQEQQGVRLVEEVLDEDEDEDDDDGDDDDVDVDVDDDDDMQEEFDRERILRAAAAAAARQRSLLSARAGENGSSRRGGGLAVNVVVTEPDNGHSRPRLHHTHTQPGAPATYDNQWMFDGTGELLGNPFLIGSNTDAYGNPVGGIVPAVGHDSPHVPGSQGAYHHGIPYHTHHGHHH